MSISGQCFSYFLPFGLSGDWVSTDPASFLLSARVGFFEPLKTLAARVDTFEDDFSFFAMVGILSPTQRWVYYHATIPLLIADPGFCSVGKKQRWDNCALCGEFRLTTREHVVPKGLYPESKGATSTFQRITIAACFDCNNGTSDDDVHFRNVVAISGEANPSVREVWEGPIRRSFEKVDGRRRALDIFKLMKPAPEFEGDRYMIYPGNDPRVLGTVRKIVRGLCHHHRLSAVVKNNEVLADVLKYPIPTDFAEAMVIAHAEPDILDYKYLLVDEGEQHSFWLLRFYERTTFVAFVFNKSITIEEQESTVEGAS